MSTKKFCDATGEEIPLRGGVEVIVAYGFAPKYLVSNDRETSRFHFKSVDVIDWPLVTGLDGHRPDMTRIKQITVMNYQYPPEFIESLNAQIGGTQYLDTGRKPLKLEVLTK